MNREESACLGGNANGLKIMAEGKLLDRHLHLHSHEIISGRWLRNRPKIYAKIFPRIVCGLFLGISIIGVLWLHWWGEDAFERRTGASIKSLPRMWSKVYGDLCR